MGTLLGFAIGYYLGSKTGPNGIDDLLKAWQTIKESEDYQALAATLTATLESAMHRGGEAAGKLVASLSSLGGKAAAEQLKAAGTNGNLQGLWAQVSQSAEVQSLVSTGAAMVMQWLEQGAAQTREGTH
ncbi:MAG: hypothetical protein ACLQU2_32200 [Candidatus Binataceae bacterium]